MSAGRRTWSKAQRLLRAPEFASLAGADANWRAARRWIALSVRMQQPVPPVPAALHPAEPDVVAPVRVDAPAPDPAYPSFVRERAPAVAAVRFGITVAKRQARRAVARNMVKRVVREAARHAAARLERAAGERSLDVLVRLKSPLPDAGTLGWSELKRTLRGETDELLGQLAAVLERGAGAVVLAQSAGAQRKPSRTARN